ncbi:MAG: cyclic pyranopterin monophosphate synthase MoaC [Candidatus Nanopelagicales bacterium]
MTDSFTHLDNSGKAKMVDVGEKTDSVRIAKARGLVTTNQEVLDLVRNDSLPKGDLFAVVRLAGIMAAKKTSELIPLCHPLAINAIEVDIETTKQGFLITAMVKTSGKTGVEMEALTAVSVAALTAIDMIKAVDKSAIITDVKLLEKSGGKSGTWTRE